MTFARSASEPLISVIWYLGLTFRSCSAPGLAAGSGVVQSLAAGFFGMAFAFAFELAADDEGLLGLRGGLGRPRVEITCAGR